MGQFKPKLVTEKTKPNHDRAVCDECGIASRGIELHATPEVNMETGKIKRKKALKILYCADCYLRGVYSELGR